MKQFWTEHRLTEDHLTRLSQMVNGRYHLHGGPLKELIRRGMVTCVKPNLPGFEYKATEIGIAALNQAREEGW